MTGLLDTDWIQAEAVRNFVARHQSELAAQLCELIPDAADPAMQTVRVVAGDQRGRWLGAR